MRRIQRLKRPPTAFFNGQWHQCPAVAHFLLPSVTAAVTKPFMAGRRSITFSVPPVPYCHCPFLFPPCSIKWDARAPRPCCSTPPRLRKRRRHPSSPEPTERHPPLAPPIRRSRPPSEQSGATARILTPSRVRRTPFTPTENQLKLRHGSKAAFAMRHRRTARSVLSCHHRSKQQPTGEQLPSSSAAPPPAERSRAEAQSLARRRRFVGTRRRRPEHHDLFVPVAVSSVACKFPGAAPPLRRRCTSPFRQVKSSLLEPSRRHHKNHGVKLELLRHR